MAYIPEKHKKYDLLPRCRNKGGEVFSYPCELLNKLEEYLPDGENLMPYGYKSYEEYYSEIDGLAKQYFTDSEILRIFTEFKAEMLRLNEKENWSVLRYIGENIGEIMGLTKGNIYYWPCSVENPVYEGVIDDEEFTSYQYPTEELDWEILEDPTGMAYRTIYGKDKGHLSREGYEGMMKQLEDMV